MKIPKVILIVLFALASTQLKSQCADSLKVNNTFYDTLSFQIYTSTANDTTNLAIYNRWGQLVKKVLNDSVMQPGYHTVIFVADSGMQIGTYVYTFTSYCLSHNGNIVHFNSLNGIQQYANNHTLNLYPNPSRDKINLQSQSALGTVKIYNAIGAVVYETTTKENTLQVDLNQMVSGIYFVQVQNQHIKIIKQ